MNSVTPKYTVDWYIKWTASILILSAISVRASGIPELHSLDMILSWFGVLLWFIVSVLWKDRALILLNGVSGIILFSGLIKHFYG